jgi:hypothetical protein
MKQPDASPSDSPSAKISKRIAELGDWRGDTLSRIRTLITQADPDVVEEWKWAKASSPGTPVWSHDGIICTGETYKTAVKLTFARGASLKDPAGLFNASLDGNVRRAIDIHEGESVNAAAFKALVREAVALNGSGKPGSATRAAKKTAAKPTLLAGGNPQIAKGDGDAPVQAYIAAMPGWKRDIGRRLDTLIVRTVPTVRKAVKWNSPFYGIEDQGWFLNFHCFTKYVKVAFFRGASLRPQPPGTSAHKDVRYLDIRETDRIDEKRLTNWIRQAAKLPGWIP